MPDLDFSVTGVEVVKFAASPLLSFKLRIQNADETQRIQSVALRCQIQMETTKRRYSAKEQSQLFELFGEPERWGRTLRSMLWAHTNATVPSFQGETTIDLPVPCTFDFNVAATKYFAGLDDGLVPLNLLFSGTIFFAGEDGGLQIEQISWSKEAQFKLPITIWRDMMDHYYPNTAWLCLRRDVFERLSRYKLARGLPTWEQALESLLPVPAKPLVEKIADAVLYEGYILYPYRPSSVKNQQRWNFGVVSPESYATAQGGSEISVMQTECLLEARAATTVAVKLRFLHLRLRDTWQEAVEREVVVRHTNMPSTQTIAFDFPGSLEQTQRAIRGAIEIRSTKSVESTFKLTVAIRNRTEFADAENRSRDDALLHSFVSTHTILETQNGAFISLLDTPAPHKAAAAQCVNTGTFPVLVGNEGERHCMLSSPIILYDYPQIAPESAGDLFDGTEIDEILTLRIMSLTDDEKRELRSADNLARKLLERTESLSPEQVMKLHGLMKRA